jgi:SAM-dependent methyltransferase
MTTSTSVKRLSTCLPCPICGATSRRLFVKHEYWIHGCVGCHHRFAEITPAADHVSRIYNDHYFQAGEAGYSDYCAEAPLLRARGQWYGRLLARYMPPHTVLDVGAAAGFILQGLRDSGWQGRGIEPNPRMAAYAATQLGLGVDPCSLEQFRSSEHFRLVSMIQVVAHFVDVRRALAAAAAVTESDGFLLTETWNRESWTARCLGEAWHEYSPPSVLHWFSPAGLRCLAAQFGFREIACGRPGKWISAGHAKSLLRYKLAGVPLGRLATGVLDLLPDRLSLPYPAEDLFWALFQRAS